VDASPRKAWYGDGVQPWDIIVERGWGPSFAAANVLKYVRRVKDPEHSLESARWYYARLYRNAAQAVAGPTAPWAEALHSIEDELSQGELMLLRREPSA
jgi:hypothetical protein